MTRVEFIKKYSPLVEKLAAQTGIFPQIVFSQAIIESSSKNGFGENYNAKYGNNFFGIRPGTSWSGATIENPEIKSESKIFRAYHSPEESIQDYFRFLLNNSRYKKAGVFTASTWQEQAQALARAGYAGAGNEEKYFSLLSKVGTTITDVLNKVVKKVTENKTESGLIFLALASLVATVYYGTRK